RRRHTRFSRDWSSDVCSSDLRVWSALFKRLPSASLRVAGQGLEWSWVVGSHATDADCEGARRFAFTSGFAPPWQPCVREVPVEEESSSGGWREWFGFGRSRDSADGSRQGESE